MSTTFSTDKRMTLVHDKTGKEWWLLEEETYESNTFPQTRRWSQVGFGDTNRAREKIIRYSAACEGGCLAGASGPILAESYIAQWRGAMVVPHFCEDIYITVKKCGYSYTDEMKAKSSAEIQKLSLAGGFVLEDEVIHTSVSKCTTAQLQLISDTLHDRSQGLSFVFDPLRRSSDKSWDGEMTPSGVTLDSSHAIGIHLVRGNFFAVQIAGKVHFGQGWEVQSEVFRDLSQSGMTLDEAARFCKQLRREIKTSKVSLQEVALVRPTKEWGYDHILTLEQIFGNAETVVVSLERLAEIQQKLYFIESLVDMTQFNFKTEHQEALFA